MHKKYTYKDGKRFGPYYYKTERVDGKIVTTYLGSSVVDNRKRTYGLYLVLGMTFFIMMALAIVVSYERSITGRVALETEGTYVPGEQVQGTFTLIFKEGELIPATTAITARLGDVEKTVSLYELLAGSSVESLEGDFYAEGFDLEGTGTGYGLAGTKVVYPEVTFELRAIHTQEENSLEEPSSGGAGSDDAGVSESEVDADVPSSETGTSDGAVSEEGPVSEATSSDEKDAKGSEKKDEKAGKEEEGTEKGAKDEKEKGASEEASSDETSASAEDASSDAGETTITGGVVSDEGTTITGTASRGDSFAYDLSEGYTVELVSGSVRGPAGEVLSDSVVLVEQDGTSVRASSSYSENVSGFGQDYQGSNRYRVRIPLDLFGLVVSNATRLTLTAVLDGMTLVEEESELVLSDLLLENETVDEPIAVLNETQTNETLEVVNETLLFLKDIPSLSLDENYSARIDLRSYFAGADAYELMASDMIVSMEGSEMIVRAVQPFAGVRSARIRAFSSEGDSVESNDFSIMSRASVFSFTTQRTKIVLGQPVYWVTNVSVPDGSPLVLPLPAGAENVSVSAFDSTGNLVQADVVSLSVPLTGQVTGRVESRPSFMSWIGGAVVAATGQVTGEVSVESVASEDVAPAEPNQSALLGEGDVFSHESSSEVVLNAGATAYTVEYYTAPPAAVELSQARGKTITLVASEALNYSDVVVIASLPNELRITNPATIQLSWLTPDAAVGYDTLKLQDDVPEVTLVGASDSSEDAGGVIGDVAPRSDVSFDEGFVDNESVVQNGTIDETVNETSVDEGLGITGAVVDETVPASDAGALNETESELSWIPIRPASENGTLDAGTPVLVPFEAADRDGDGFIDSVAWVVPHFSNQTYEIIVITKADHLDENRTFISDVYESVKALDGNWSESIPDGHYVRVTFERNLTQMNDITIYPRVLNGTPLVTVYEKAQTVPLAVFDNLTDESYYKIFLTSLPENYSQDVFDLRISNGSVAFDHIVDPIPFNVSQLLVQNGSFALVGNSTVVTPARLMGENSTFILQTVVTTSSAPNILLFSNWYNTSAINFTRQGGVTSATVHWQAVDGGDKFVDVWNYSQSYATATARGLYNITPVNTSRSFILAYPTLHTATANQINRGLWMATFLNGSVVNISRSTTGTAGNLNFYVVSINDSAVYNGTYAFGAAENNVTIALPATVNKSQSFMITSYRSSRIQDANYSVMGYVVDDSNIHLARHGYIAGTIAAWFLVSDPAFYVQHGFVNMSQSSTSTQAVLPVPVNRSRSFVITSWNTNESASHSRVFATADFNGSTINFTRGIGGSWVNISWSVVSMLTEFPAVPDTFGPQVTINEPANYTYSLNQIRPFVINVTLNENGSTVLYSFDNGANNFSFVTPDNRSYNATNYTITSGSYTIRIFANDSVGNRNDTANVTFSVDELLLTDCATLNRSDTTFRLNQSISTTYEVCFNVTQSNVTLDGRNFALTRTDLPLGVAINATDQGIFTLVNLSVGGYPTSVTVQSLHSALRGGNLTVINSSVTSLSSDGYSNLTSPSGPGSHGGLIVMLNSSFAQGSTISVVGGNGTGTGAPGFPGDVYLEGALVNLSLRSVNFSSGRSNTVLLTGYRSILSINFSNTFETISTQYGSYALGQLILSNFSAGSVTWFGYLSGEFLIPSPINIPKNLSQFFYFGPNLVYLNATGASQLNRPANITLAAVPNTFVNPAILKNDTPCASSVCVPFTPLFGAVSFNVSSWSNYSIGPADGVAPNVNFTSPTPNNNSLLAANAIYVNVSSNDSYPHYVLTDFNRDVQLWLRMDSINASNDPIDSSWYSRNGTRVNEAHQNNSGRFGKSFLFDGNNDRISVPMGQYANFTGKNISISFWINGTAGTSTGVVISSQFISASPYWVIGGNTGTSGRLKIRIQNATTGVENVLTAGAVNTSNWTHVVVVLQDAYSGSSTNVTSYVDGAFYTSYLLNVNGQRFNLSDQNVTLGRWTSWGSWAGHIDELLMVNRALDAQEVSALYNATANQYYHNFTGLSTGNYNITAYAVDSSGNVNQTETRTATLTADDALPVVNLLHPANDSSPYVPLVWFAANVSDAVNVSNATLYIWNASGLVGTNFTSLNVTNALVNVSFVLPRADTYVWNFLAGDNSSNYAMNATNWTLVTTTYPISTCGGLNVTGATYVMLNNLTTTGHCLTINNHTITVDGRYFTIDGDYGSSDQAIRAIRFVSLRVANINITDFGYGLMFSGVNHSVVSNLSISSSSTVAPSGNVYGAYFINSLNVTLKDSSILRVGTDGADSIAAGVELTTTVNSTITGVEASHIRGGTFDVVGGDGIGFQLSSSSNGNNFTNITSINNTGSSEYSSAFYVFGSSNNTFSYFFSSGNPLGIGIPQNSHGNLFSNGVLNGTSSDAIYLEQQANYNTFYNISITYSSALANDFRYNPVSPLAEGGNFTRLKDMPYVGKHDFSTNGFILILENSSAGEIVFLQNVNGTGANLTRQYRIANNFAYVNGSQPGLNKSANVTLYNMPGTFTDPIILRGGAPCSDCYNFTHLNAATVIFNVSSWSNYSIGERPLVSDTTAPVVNLLHPANDSSPYVPLVWFAANVSDAVNVSNATLYIWNSSSLVGTNFTSVNQSDAIVNVSFVLPRNDTYVWNFLAGDNSSNYAMNATNWTLRTLTMPLDICMNLSQANSVYIQIGTLVPTGVTPCISVDAPNITILGNGYQMTNATYNYTVIFSDEDNTSILGVNISLSSEGPRGLGIHLNVSSRARVFNTTLISGDTGLLVERSNVTVLDQLAVRDNDVGVQIVIRSNQTNITNSLFTNVSVGLSTVGTGNIITDTFVSNISVTSANTGVSLVAATRPVISDVVVSGSAVGISVDSLSSGTNLTRISLHNNTAGISISALNARFENSYINSSVYYGLRIYAAAKEGIFRNLTFVGNNMSLYFLPTTGALRDHNLTNIFVYNSTGPALVFDVSGISAAFDRMNFTNLSVIGTNSSYPDLQFLASGTDLQNIRFKDSYFANYSFADTGGRYFTFESSLFGKIKFLDYINGSGTNLSADVRILNNSATVRNEINPGLNISANVTLYGISTTFTNPVILKDDTVECSDCYNFTDLNAGTVIFNVSSWSNYSIGERPSVADLIAPIVNLLAPPNDSSTYYALTWFAANITDAVNVSNATLYIWNATALIGTNFSSVNQSDAIVNVSFVLPRNDTYVWNFLAGDNSSNYAMNATNWTLTITGTCAGPVAGADWIIEAWEDCLIQGQNITMPSDKSVFIYGNLTFVQSALTMQLTTDGLANVTVQSGGRLNVTQGSKFNSTSTSLEYGFTANSGSALSLTHSEFFDASWGASADDLRGIRVQARDARIENNTIFGGYGSLRIAAGANNTLVKDNNISGWGTGNAIAIGAFNVTFISNTVIGTLGNQNTLSVEAGSNLTLISGNNFTITSGAGGITSIIYMPNAISNITIVNNTFFFASYTSPPKSAFLVAGSAPACTNCIFKGNRYSAVNSSAFHFNTIHPFVGFIAEDNWFNESTGNLQYLNASSQYAANLTFLNSTGLNTSMIYIGPGVNGSFILDWKVNVNVSNSTSALAGASASFYNNTNGLLFSELTNANGFTGMYNVTSDIINVTGVYTRNPHALNATLLGYYDYANASVNITQSVQLDVLMTRITNLAPNITLVYVNSSSGSNKTEQDLNCYTNLSDPDPNTFLNVTVFWYNNSVLHLVTDYNTSYANASAFIATLDDRNTTKGHNWTCGVRVFDGSLYTGPYNATYNLTILNTLPSITHLAPPDASRITNRTPVLNFTVFDADDESATWQLNVTLVPAGACSDEPRSYFATVTGLSGGTNVTKQVAPDLRCLYDNLDYYNWTVRANDSDGFGEWTVPWRFNVTSVVSITLLNSSIDFGSIDYLQWNDTSDDSPLPFLLENDGNSFVNVTITSIHLWETQPGGSNYFQFKAGNYSSELGSFIGAQSQIAYLAIPTSDGLPEVPALCFASFNYTDTSDTGEIDINVTVPNNEPPGVRRANVTLVASLSE